MHLSFRHIFYVMACVIGLVFIFHSAKSLLTPLVFALLISLILYPLVKWTMNKGVPILPAILANMFASLLLIAGVIYFFSTQIVRITQGYGQFTEKISALYDEVMRFVAGTGITEIIPGFGPSAVEEKVMETINESGLPIMSDTLSFTGVLLSHIILTVVYIFLILFYHKTLVKALTLFATKENQPKVLAMLKDAQKVGQQYLTGLITLILIIGTLNSIALFGLGIDYALFFGFMAAILAIIPYIGTFIGGFIPAFYALVTYDTYWYAIGVVMLFWVVQLIDDNFLTPRIIGGNLHLNALTSILALIAGGVLWGIPGMIVFIPLASIFKVVCEHFDELKPIATLMKDSGDRDHSESLLQKIKRWTKIKRG